MMHVLLTDGRIVSLPIIWFPLLHEAALPHKSSERGSGVFFGQQTQQKWPLIGPKKTPDPICEAKPHEATPQQREHYEIDGGGVSLHWPEIDEDLSVAGFLDGADRQSA
jgi:hypothetical protein